MLSNVLSATTVYILPSINVGVTSITVNVVPVAFTLKFLSPAGTSKVI